MTAAARGLASPGHDEHRELAAPRPALFDLEDGLATPGELARGPWSPDALHGAAVAALVAQLVDDHSDGRRRHVARLALVLIRPVPRAALAVTVSTLRGGRNLMRLDATICAGGELVARAAALRR